jgi:ATP-binding cassette, subfamily B, bacterial
MNTENPNDHTRSTAVSMGDGLAFLWKYAATSRRLLLILIVIGTASAVTQLLAPVLLGQLVDVLVAGGPVAAIRRLAFVYGGLGLLRLTLSMGHSWLAQSVAWEATNAMRHDMLAGLFSRSITFLGDFGVGELLERVDGDATTLVSVMANFFLRVSVSALLLVGSTVYMFTVIDWRFGILFVATSIITFVLVRTAATWSTSLWRTHQEAIATLTNHMGESVNGAGDLIANGLPAFRLREFERLNITAGRLAARASIRTTLTGSVSRFCFVGATAGLILLGNHLFLSGVVSIGTVYVAVRLLNLIMRPIEEINRQSSSLGKAIASSSRIAELMNSEHGDGDREGTGFPDRAIIAMKDVSFEYPDGTVALNDINLKLKPSEVVGVAGPTGSGKSTLLSLAAFLNRPSKGHVLLNGQEMDRYGESVIHQRCAVVGQSAWVFHGTLWDNICIFAADEGVPDLEKVLLELGLSDWLQTLENGLATPLTPDSLSRGQKRLVCLARAFVGNPLVVALDEPTANVDRVTGRLVQKATERLVRGRTALIVSHDLDLLKLADRIVVLQQGKVVEQGTIGKLLNDASSTYARLMNAKDRI